MIPRSFIDELLQRVRLSDVISRRVTLKRAGKEFSGLCPFHNEKSPSFTVNDDKGFYYCFGCNAGGDALRFITETEGKNYPEAIEMLAQTVGMTVPRQPAANAQDEARRARLRRLAAVMKITAERYSAILRGSAGAGARNYLYERGLDDTAIASFGIGYAPDDFQATQQYLKEKGVAEQDMKDTGLCAVSQKGRMYDRFRGRIMFPIRNRRGDIIAFGGRLLVKDDKAPKYLNSPETPLFDKSATLYNIDKASAAAQKAGTLIVTEGYMDVCVPAAHGAAHAVASMGTAVGERHIQLLWRYCDTPVICMDGDEAGRRAAVKVAERVLPMVGPGKSVAFAELPPGQDPADYTMANGGEAFSAFIRDRATPLSDVLIRHLLARFPGAVPEDQAARLREIERLCGLITDATTANMYRRAFKDAHWQALRAAGGGSSKTTGNYTGRKDHVAKKKGVSVPAPMSPPNVSKDPEQCVLALAGLLLCCTGLMDMQEINDSLAEMEQPILDKAVEIALESTVCAGGESSARLHRFAEAGFEGLYKPLLNIIDFYGFRSYSPEQCRNAWHFYATTYRLLLLKADYDEQLRVMTEASQRRAEAIYTEIHALTLALASIEK